MYNLFKKEIILFFGSLIGYITIGIFLLASGLFLWVFPGNYNIPDSGYATLEGLFLLAPWLYLFLVPAITMRLFSEEKKQGTIELLLTHPISNIQLVLAKFFSGFVLVVISLLPTLIYFLSVYLLGNPIGNIDMGATWGSFTGLFFLAAIYVAIGIFASSLTDNQIVAFISAMGLSFVFYVGFEFIANSGVPYVFETFFTWIGINEHYLSISRGVIELNDLFYFVGMAGIFLYLTSFFVRKDFSFSKKYTIRKFFIPVIFVGLFIISENYSVRFDLTSDKRFSVADISKEVTEGIEKNVEVELFLDGELPAGFRRLQQAVIEKTDGLNLYSEKQIRLRITDPYKITNPEKRNTYFEELQNKGIKPWDIRQKTDQGVNTLRLFPGAIIRYGGKEIAVNFLKNSMGFSSEMNLNHSVENIEYELVNSIRRLSKTKKQMVAFLTGHGEFNRYEVYDISRSLQQDFDVSRIEIRALQQENNNINLLIIAGPTGAFPEKDKLLIDQYIMNGGRVMWLVDPVQVSLDSLSNGHMTMAFPAELNINDQLFRYGVRLNNDLLQDVACSKLLVNTAPAGVAPDFTPQNWYYSPLLTPSDTHPVSRSLNVVMAEFVSSIDTVGNNPEVRKSVILSTSPYARKVVTPTSVSLQNINNPPARELFNIPFIPTGVLLEGQFISVFKNRVVSELGFSSAQIIEKSKPTKMAVFSDGSLIANQVMSTGAKPSMLPLGFDRVSQQTFANKELLLNTMHYLTDDLGIMQLRNRTMKLRMLDKVLLREELIFWKWLNVLSPIVLIILFGIVFNIIRYKRFNR